MSLGVLIIHGRMRGVPLKMHTLSTFVWTLHGVFLAEGPVLIGDCGIGSFVVAILASQWAVRTILAWCPWS